MTTLIKIIVAAVLSLTLFSCNFDINLNNGVRGNGNVTTENRLIDAPFESIKATEGLDVYLTQSDTEGIIIEADDNLHDLILTDVEDGILKIHTKESIGHASSKKVKVSFKDISSIVSTSGSDVYSTNTITVDDLSLKSTSGSDMELEVSTNILRCKATSGSDLKLTGKTKTLHVEATSGSDIKAADLIAVNTDAKVTSGADITLNTTETLNAKASSGGDIKYYGNPKTVSKDNSSSGSVKAH